MRKRGRETERGREREEKGQREKGGIGEGHFIYQPPLCLIHIGESPLTPDLWVSDTEQEVWERRALVRENSRSGVAAPLGGRGGRAHTDGRTPGGRRRAAARVSAYPRSPSATNAPHPPSSLPFFTRSLAPFPRLPLLPSLWSSPALFLTRFLRALSPSPLFTSQENGLQTQSSPSLFFNPFTFSSSLLSLLFLSSHFQFKFKHAL